MSLPGAIALVAACLAAVIDWLGVARERPRDGGGALVGVGVSAVVLVSAGRPILAGARRAGMGGPVAVYFGAICLMAIAATASVSPGATAGAWLFILSGALLGWDGFAAPPAGRGAAAAQRPGA